MADADAITTDALFEGRLRLRQPARGHRAGTDAVLLAAAVPADFAGRVYDVGAATGAVGLSVALGAPDTSVSLLERDGDLAATAAENIALNELGSRVQVACLDILDRVARRPLLGGADLLLTNPPFLEAGRVRASPEPKRRAAHVLPAGGLDAWLAACLALTAPHGTMILIHRAEALPALLEAMGRRWGGVSVMPVHPRAGDPASRLLLRARKGSRAPFRLMAPLVLHADTGFTAEAAALHEGTARIAW